MLAIWEKYDANNNVIVSSPVPFVIASNCWILDNRLSISPRAVLVLGSAGSLRRLYMTTATIQGTQLKYRPEMQSPVQSQTNSPL